MENRIKHALFLDGWSFLTGDKAVLKRDSSKILINEYQPSMKGKIFCPECSANLFRSPEDKPISKNGKSYFGHARGIKTDCGLRTKRAEGKKYETEEEALRAIQSEELVIVEGFIKDKPFAPQKTPDEYDATQVEDVDGPMASVPISRHRGESFSLPSKFKTVRGICNNFDENIYRYFYMPNSKVAVQLIDLLTDIKTVTREDDTPRIYYGIIQNSYNAGSTKQNIRMTRLKYKNVVYLDFYVKAIDELQGEKGIDDNTKDRVILVYGTISINGRGLCIESIGWGEFALLPDQYNGILYPST
jgi:hypothetical protein